MADQQMEGIATSRLEMTVQEVHVLTEKQNVFAEALTALPKPGSVFGSFKSVEPWKEYAMAYGIVKGMADKGTGELTASLYAHLVSGYAAARDGIDRSRMSVEVSSEIISVFDRVVDNASVIPDTSMMESLSALPRGRGRNGVL